MSCPIFSGDMPFFIASITGVFLHSAFVMGDFFVPIMAITSAMSVFTCIPFLRLLQPTSQNATYLYRVLQLKTVF